MGSFNLADGVTGATIQSGDRIVAFLIHHGSTDPALRENPNHSSHRATDRYKLASLPMHGAYDDLGNLKWDRPVDIATQLALKMTALSTPESLGEYAVGFRSSVQLLGRENHEPRGDTNGNYTRTYGLAVFHESTFNHMVDMAGGEQGSMEVEEIYGLLDLGDAALEQAQRNGVFHDRDTREHLFSLAEACSLKDKRTYVGRDLKPVETPALCRALSRDVYHPDFIAVVDAEGLTNLMNKDPRTAEDGDGPYRRWPKLRAYLQDLWSVRCFIWAMDRLGAEVWPARALGMAENSASLLSLSINTALAAAARQLERAATAEAKERLRQQIVALTQAQELQSLS